MQNVTIDELYKHPWAEQSITGGKKFLSQHREFVEDMLDDGEEIHAFIWPFIPKGLYLLTNSRVIKVTGSIARSSFWTGIQAIVWDEHSWPNDTLKSAQYLPRGGHQNPEVRIRYDGSSPSVSSPSEEEILYFEKVIKEVIAENKKRK